MSRGRDASDERLDQRVRGRRVRRSQTEELVGYTTVAETVIYPQTFGNADREVGGVLVGRYPAHGGLPMLTGAIPALSADEQRASLTFTQETWAHVHEVLERDFPEEERIVGWYHSHPNFGIFLSGHDLFIHENFFSGTSQIAIVVDPLGLSEGLFAWRDGEVVCVYERATPSGWESLDEVERRNDAKRRRKVTLDTPEVERGGTGEGSIRVSHRTFNWFAILAVLAVVAAAVALATLAGGSGQPASTPMTTTQTAKPSHPTNQSSTAYRSSQPNRSSASAT